VKFRSSIAYHDGVGMIENRVDAGNHQARYGGMWLRMVVAVWPHGWPELDICVVDAQVITLAQQALGQLHHRALAQIVRARLKLKPRMPTFLLPFSITV